MAKLGGDAVGENVLCAQGGAILDKQAGGPAFQARYKERFKQEPDVYAPSFYDQTMFIAQAMKRRQFDRSVGGGAALHTTSYKGVVGNYAYDASRQHEEVRRHHLHLQERRAGRRWQATDARVLLLAAALACRAAALRAAAAARRR